MKLVSKIENLSRKEKDWILTQARKDQEEI